MKLTGLLISSTRECTCMCYVLQVYIHVLERSYCYSDCLTSEKLTQNEDELMCRVQSIAASDTILHFR